MIKIIIPGYVTRFAIEGSQVPKEEHWPRPEVRRVGIGYQWVYYCDAIQYELILSHISMLAFGMDRADKDARAESRKVQRWFRSILNK